MHCCPFLSLNLHRSSSDPGKSVFSLVEIGVEIELGCPLSYLPLGEVIYLNLKWFHLLVLHSALGLYLSILIDFIYLCVCLYVNHEYGLRSELYRKIENKSLLTLLILHSHLPITSFISTHHLT